MQISARTPEKPFRWRRNHHAMSGSPGAEKRVGGEEKRQAGAGKGRHILSTGVKKKKEEENASG